MNTCVKDVYLISHRAHGLPDHIAFLFRFDAHQLPLVNHQVNPSTESLNWRREIDQLGREMFSKKCPDRDQGHPMTHRRSIIP